MKRRTPVLALTLVLALTACATMRAVIRTVADAAHAVCELWAADQGDALRISPSDFCAVEDNVRPFIDAVLAAQREAGAVVGARHGVPPPVPPVPPTPPEAPTHGEP